MISLRALPTRLATGLALSVFALGAISCDSSTSPRNGELTLLLTDAPGDVVSAIVTIDRIYMQPSEAGDNGRVVLLEDDVTTDLLTLVGTTQELFADALLPVGAYSQLRFVISGAYIEVEQADGSTLIYASSPDYAGLPEGATVAGELQMPSLAQSGLKVKLPGDVVVIDEEVPLTLVVDFDVAQSFGQLAGGSGRWVMNPVITAARPE